MITAEVIKDLNSPELQYVAGSLQAVATQVLPPEQALKDSLVFVGKPAQLEQALANEATIIIAHKSLPLPEGAKTTFFKTPSITLAMATVLPLFDGKMNRFNQTEKIHPTAIIHGSAHLGQNVCVGPYVVIGEHAKVGDYCTIGAHTVIEPYAEIGDHTLLHPQVFIGSHCILGTHCEVHPHTTIGADGFSFAMDAQGHHKKIPQIGRVVIGNSVEFGANCAVDRAALTETRIGNGTKFDNFSHIAHNCVIGSDCVMAAGFKVAGSTRIGSNCMFGGDVVVGDHLEIVDRVIVAGRSAVTSSVLMPGQYGGHPLEPLRDSLRSIANRTQVTRIRKDLSRVLKHLGLNEE